MFRFKQRLSTILGGRQLTSQEQSGLDAYDIELEDTLSNVGGGTNNWKVAGSTLEVNETVATLTEVYIDPTNAANASVDVFDDGTSTSQVSFSANGKVLSTATVQTKFQTGTAIVDLVASGNIAALSGDAVNVSAGSGTAAVSASGGPINITQNSNGNIVLTVFSGGFIKVGVLPTSDPGVSGALYTVLGVLHVSP